MDGGDGSWAVLHNSTSSIDGKLSIVVDEDQIKDTERKHTTEQVAYLLFNE